MIFLMFVIQKDDTDELICKAEIETQTQRTDMDTGDKRGDTNWENEIDIYTLLCI